MLPSSRVKCIHNYLNTPIHLFLGREVGLEVRRAVVLGAAAVAGVYKFLVRNKLQYLQDV